MSDDDADFHEAEEDASPSDEVDPDALRHVFRGLAGTDLYIAMQATNLGIVDSFLTDLEQQVRREIIEEDGTPRTAFFLGALTQMWVFAAYELLRTWRQRAEDAIRLSDNGGLRLRIDELRKNAGFQHHNKEMLARQLERYLTDPASVGELRADLRRTHFVFRHLEALRVNLAKHEVISRKKRNKPLAYAPGYARIDIKTGSLQYELSAGQNVYRTITRRELADDLRIMCRVDPPDQRDINEFDAMLDDILSETFGVVD